MAVEMKNSGVQWIGEIPRNWLLASVGHLFKIKAGGDAKPNLYEYDFDEGHPYPVYTNTLDKNQVYAYSSKAFFHGPCITVTGRGAVGHAIYREDSFDAIIRLLVLKPRLDVSCKYFTYFIDNVCKFFTNNATIGQLSAEQIYPAKVCLPPLQEQEAIANFLDEKCAEIDGLLADLEEQIKTLRAYEKSLIAETVTHGLNPNAQMKQSGITWADTIPTHWNVKPLYCFYSQRVNKNLLGKEQNLLSLSFGSIVRKDINSVGGLIPASYNTYNIVENQDIIIRPTDLQNDKRSLRTGLVKERGIITSAYIALKPKATIHSPFFHYLLHSYDIKKVFYNMGNGVRQGLNYSEFSRLMLFEPPIEEQIAIANYLDDKIARIEDLIGDKFLQTLHLKEYKSSLIYEYVTGKKQLAL